MLISVLLPVFNKVDFLARTFFSVIEQTHESWELIVVDDGSTDGSWEELVRLRHLLGNQLRDRIKLFRQENLGQSAARYIALSKARGELIALLDADDFWAPTKLEEQSRFLLANPDLNLVLCNYCIFSKKGRKPKAISLLPVEKKILGWSTTENFGGLVESTGLFRANYIREVLKFDAPQVSGGLEICLRSLEWRVIGCVNMILCGYIESYEGLHMSKTQMAKSFGQILLNEELSEPLRKKMAQGFILYQFFWIYRNYKTKLKLKTLSKLIATWQVEILRYGLKTIFRSLTAMIRYVLLYNESKALRMALKRFPLNS